jgi:hypothetical protein
MTRWFPSLGCFSRLVRFEDDLQNLLYQDVLDPDIMVILDRMVVTKENGWESTLPTQGGGRGGCGGDGRIPSPISMVGLYLHGRAPSPW